MFLSIFSSWLSSSESLNFSVSFDSLSPKCSSNSFFPTFSSNLDEDFCLNLAGAFLNLSNEFLDAQRTITEPFYSFSGTLELIFYRKNNKRKRFSSKVERSTRKSRSRVYHLYTSRCLIQQSEFFCKNRKIGGEGVETLLVKFETFRRKTSILFRTNFSKSSTQPTFDDKTKEIPEWWLKDSFSEWNQSNTSIWKHISGSLFLFN